MPAVNETRIKDDVLAFLKAAQNGEVAKVTELLKADPKLIASEEMQGFCALHWAAFNGNAALLEVLLSYKDQGLQLNQKNLDGNTPLMLAAKMKQDAVISTLIEAGADVDFKGKGGATAAHHAAAMGHAKTLKHLIDLGATLEKDASEAGSVLHWACHSEDCQKNNEVISLLLYTAKFPIDAVDVHGGTPLFVAIHMKRSATVAFLLEHGANANATCPADGSTVLMTAAEHGDVADVKLLLAFGASGSPKNKAGKTALELATAGNKKELAKPAADAKKRDADAARFKAQGNKVFAEGESMKAAKFYTLAITLQPTTHVFFSNRSACNFNTKSYQAAYSDACRCIALNPAFVRGYFRKASTLKALGLLEESKEVIEEGLALDTQNADLNNLKNDIKKITRS